MGKLPAFLFYANDWSRDLEEHPLEIEGAWIRLICKLFYSETRGSFSKTLPQIAKILGNRAEKTLKLLKYLQDENIADIPTDLSRIDNKTLITIESRRMISDEKKREDDRKRQQKKRDSVTE